MRATPEHQRCHYFGCYRGSVGQCRTVAEPVCAVVTRPRPAWTQRSVKPFDARKPVKPGIEGHDSPDIMLLHDRQMNGVARRQVPMTEDDGLRSINCSEIN